MHISIFASGSGGNCLLFRSAGTAILIDAGISARRICGFLASEGLVVEDLDAILISHEHSDHVSGLSTLLKRHSAECFAAPITAHALQRNIEFGDEYIGEMRPGVPLQLGGAVVTAFNTEHDTPQSVGYRLDTHEGSFGVCTDLGHVTDEVLDCLRGVDVALIETNHDLDLLRSGPYPPQLKRRILSDFGHLSNEAGAELACELVAAGAKKLILGHLSRENNSPAFALEAVERALSAKGLTAEVVVAPPLGPLNVDR